MPKQKRLVFRVRWNKDLRQWELCNSNGVTTDAYTLKRGMVQTARAHVKQYWKEDGQLAQLVVHKKDGKIELEATYGKDPRRYKS